MTEKKQLLIAVGVAAAAVGLGALIYIKNNQPKPFNDASIKHVQLYERLGGELSVTAIINRLYDLIVYDSELRQFFKNADKKVKYCLNQHIKKEFALFIKNLFGGPVDYDGKGLKAAHKNLGLTEKHFQIVISHLRKTLLEIGIDKKEIEDAVELFNGFKKDLIAE